MSSDEDAFDEYFEIMEDDFNNLDISDQVIIEEIQDLLSELSEEGTDYFEEYFCD